MYKYREGKVESTLERELNVPEIVAEKANGTPLQLGTFNRVRVIYCLYLVATGPMSVADTRL